MNRISRLFFALGVPLLFCASVSTACPSGCAPYYDNFVVVASGHDHTEVLERGQQAAQKLGGRFVSEGDTLSARVEKCPAAQIPCLVFVTSDEARIGKQGWTVEEAARGDMDKKTFAVAYFLPGLTSTASAEKKAAKRLLTQTRKRIPETYLLPILQCSCE